MLREDLQKPAGVLLVVREVFDLIATAGIAWSRARSIAGASSFDPMTTATCPSIRLSSQASMIACR